MVLQDSRPSWIYSYTCSLHQSKGKYGGRFAGLDSLAIAYIIACQVSVIEPPFTAQLSICNRIV